MSDLPEPERVATENLRPPEHSEEIRCRSGDEVGFSKSELDRLNTRRWILSFAKPGGIGAEIGVFRGHFSEILIEKLRPRRIYLVDPWTRIGETFGWGEDSEYTGFGKLTTAYALADTKRRTSRFIGAGVEVRFVEEFALKFFSMLDQKLDWVYLDASHKLEATMSELRAIDSVLADGAVIMGDDWHPNPSHQHHGVFLAVNEFLRENNRYEILAAGPGNQWAIRVRGYA